MKTNTHKNGSVIGLTNSVEEVEKFTNDGYEKFGIANHKPTGKARIIAWDSHWVPVGPEFSSYHEAGLTFNKLSEVADELGVGSILSFIRKIDQNSKDVGGMTLPTLTDREWLEAWDQDEKESAQKQSQSGPVQVESGQESPMDWAPSTVRINHKN